ncbi:choline-binding transcriptional repressor BetI [Ovoidimarina sediminis]|uniref:choline-binding transcriptional repressor BetI n=1 Tax=Ovoidimarina sediminis TaxID=3079856 RepID=UPI0029104222|nr:transcriptional regulator BetI [Rhodophyticola sp. MJ-SS7]MDU8945093.1 transcriptional regulator BetI [Rhodophyticola sp. MJ-SS7]
MPRTGMEPIRRKALVDAAIVEVGAHGAHAVTVGAIARRAGVSSALAHHYFGAKSDLLTAAMRRILGDLGQAVRAELARAGTPEERVRAVIRASFAAPNFRDEVISAWLNFYVSALSEAQAARLLKVYHRRLHSTLAHALRPRFGAGAHQAAETLAALIDGIYIRAALGDGGPEPEAATALCLGVYDAMIGEARHG